MADAQSTTGPRPDQELASRVVEMRDRGLAWSEIQRAHGLTRQQARYAYQLGKRAQRRRERKAGSEEL